jgi:ankyrin repeat protein
MPRQYNIGFASVDLSAKAFPKSGETAPRAVHGQGGAQTAAISKRAKEQTTQRRQRELSHEERELFQAVLNDDAQLIDRLLDAGVSPNATSRGGWTPLMWATIDGRVAIAQKLLQHGASVNVKNNRGMTPLMYAAWNGQGDLARLFIEHGARIHDRDSNGATALYYAQDPLAKFTRREERPDIVNLLIAGGAKK